MTSYGVGALASLAISVAIALIVYGLGMLPLDLWNVPAWLLGPLGVYTVGYAFKTGKDQIYYAVWGAVMLMVATASAAYTILSPIVAAGLLILMVAIIALAGYWRG